jgi:hypothetical protein
VTDIANAEAELLTKINAAVTAHDEAQKAQIAAVQEQVSRSKALGMLLNEIHGLPQYKPVKSFEALLKKAEGLPSLSWAYDCMRLAGGRTTEAKLKKEASERQQKVRDKAKAAKLAKEAEAAAKKDSVTESVKTQQNQTPSIPSRNLPAQLPVPKQPEPPAHETSAEATAKERMAENANPPKLAIGGATEEASAKSDADKIYDLIEIIACSVRELASEALVWPTLSKKNNADEALKRMRLILAELREHAAPPARNNKNERLAANGRAAAA